MFCRQPGFVCICIYAHLCTETHEWCGEYCRTTWGKITKFIFHLFFSAQSSLLCPLNVLILYILRSVAAVVSSVKAGLSMEFQGADIFKGVEKKGCWEELRLGGKSTLIWVCDSGERFWSVKIQAVLSRGWLGRGVFTIRVPGQIIPKGKKNERQMLSPHFCFL